ncbi:MAG: lysylphosphatidylglycerol synthase transmembrane domain-containing protein [Nitrososphaerales archaeon]
MKLAKATPAAIALSIGFIILYSLLFGVRFEDVASLGMATLLASGSLVVLRLITQGIRFHILTSGLTHRSVLSSVLARVSSEFVSLTTPTFVGGEAVRIAWLKAKNVELGKAAWLVFLEIYFDVASTALVIYISTYYLVMIGEYLLALLSALISTGTTAFFTFIFIYSRKKVICLPTWLLNSISRLLGVERGARIVRSLEQTLLSYHNSASSLRSVFTVKRALGAAACTLLMILLSGAVTYFIVGSAPNLNGLLLSISGFYISLVVGNMPITLGGSGISELTMKYFAANILGLSSWAKVIAWRIVTYHLPLTICGASLAALSYKELISKNIKSKDLNRL